MGVHQFLVAAGCVRFCNAWSLSPTSDRESVMIFESSRQPRSLPVSAVYNRRRILCGHYATSGERSGRLDKLPPTQRRQPTAVANRQRSERNCQSRELHCSSVVGRSHKLNHGLETAVPTQCVITETKQLLIAAVAAYNDEVHSPQRKLNEVQIIMFVYSIGDITRNLQLISATQGGTRLYTEGLSSAKLLSHYGAQRLIIAPA